MKLAVALVALLLLAPMARPCPATGQHLTCSIKCPPPTSYVERLVDRPPGLVGGGQEQAADAQAHEQEGEDGSGGKEAGEELNSTGPAWSLPSNVTVYPGDLIVSGASQRLVIRDCKFIIRGSLLVLDGAETLIEDSVVLLDVSSSSRAPSNVTVSGSGRLRLVDSVLGTTGLLLVLSVDVSSSALVATGSLISNASVKCWDADVELADTTVRGRVELMGSSSLAAINATITSSLVVRHSSSADLEGTYVGHLLIEFYKMSYLIMRDIVSGYIRSWSFATNATVGTIFIDLSLRDCYVGSWSLNVTQTAIVAVESSRIWEASTYGYSVLKLYNLSVGELVAHERSALWLEDSSANLLRASDRSYVALREAGVLALIAEDESEVSVVDCALMSVLALHEAKVSIHHTAICDACFACSPDAEVGLEDCIITEKLVARGSSTVVATYCSVSEVEASDRSTVKLVDCYFTNLAASGKARIEVWWSLRVGVSLDGQPLKGATVRVLFKNETEVAACTTDYNGSCLFCLMGFMVIPDGLVQIQPYLVRVEHGPLWALREVWLSGPTFLPIELEEEAEVAVWCLDAGGRPLQGAYVVVLRGGDVVRRQITGPEGLVVLEDLPAGNYTIYVIWQGIEVARRSLLVHGVDDEITIACAVFDVIVRVRGLGEAVEGALVSLAMLEAPYIHFTAETNASGVAVLEDVPIGPYELFVRAEGFLPYEIRVEVKAQHQVFEVELEPETPTAWLGPPTWLAVAVICPLAAAGAVAYITHRRRTRGASSSRRRLPHPGNNGVSRPTS